MARSIISADQLPLLYPSYPFEMDKIREVTDRYPMLISPYYLRLIRQPGDPFWKQAVPDAEELMDRDGMIDPLAEEAFSPVPNITHRYPDRVLFTVSNRCAMYCRFCTRKRKTGKMFPVNDKTIEGGLAYIRNHSHIRDVLVSGGDPLLLEDDELAEILDGLRSIPHVEIIRIGSRVPCTLPHRITANLAAVLRRFHPVYINTHFNHPDEITNEAAHACSILSDAGIPLGCQTVLMKGVNDSPGVMKKLMQKLLTIRVRPYYIHHMDITCGTAHFRTSIKAGLRIIEALRGHTSGMCVPHYVLDLPGGGGKVPITPEHVIGLNEKELLLKNYQGETYRFKVSQEDENNFSQYGLQQRELR